MRRWLTWIAEHPGPVGVGLALASALALAGLVDLRDGSLRLRVDPSTSGLVASGDRAQRFYDETRERFGSDDRLVVALDVGDVFDPDNLRDIARLTRRIGELGGVADVISLANATNVRAVDGDIEIAPLLEGVSVGPAAIARLREELRDNPFHRNTLVSEDEHSAVLLVGLDALSNPELPSGGLGDEIQRLAAELLPGAEVFVSGSPQIRVELSRAILDNLAALLPLVFLLMGGALLLAFRTAGGVLVPLATIVIALLWTLGTIAWIGRPLNVVTSIVPPLIITLGFAYAMHLVSEYYECAEALAAAGETERRTYVREALHDVALPIAVTGLTTGIGFLALASSPLPAIREFGLMASLGVLFAVAASLLFTPTLLHALPPARMRTERGPRLLARLADALARFDLERRTWILATGWVALLVALVGMSQIRVGAEHIENFRADSEVRIAYGAVNEALQGANPITIVVETQQPEGLIEVAHLQAIHDVQRWLESQPEIGATSSFVDYLMLLHRAFFDGDPEAFRLPESGRGAKQLLLFGDSDALDSLIDPRYTRAAITVRAKVNDSPSVSALLERIQARTALLPDALTATATGDLVVLNQTLDEVARGQLRSIGLAVVTIYLVLSALFTSFRTGLLALFPNVLPIAIFFGALGWSEIPLSASTSLIACIALGIAVDDTIHYLVRFNADAKRSADERGATASALRSVIRPVTFTTLGLCLGFLALGTSELRNQVHFGLLAAATIAAAWLIDVTLTPALCSRLRVVSLWDVLSLDLGEEPQRTVPLLAGLSLRQARIVALMLTIVERPAGTRIFQERERRAARCTWFWRERCSARWSATAVASSSPAWSAATPWVRSRSSREFAAPT